MTDAMSIFTLWVQENVQPLPSLPGGILQRAEVGRLKAKAREDLAADLEAIESAVGDMDLAVERAFGAVNDVDRNVGS